MLCALEQESLSEQSLNPAKSLQRIHYRDKYSISPQDVQVNDFFVGPSNFIPYI